MATKTDKTTFRGLGILDPRFLTSDVLWAAESTYDQAGPRPGVPEPQQVSDFVLKSTGSQTADSSIRVKLQRGGYPGTSGAAAIWRPNAGSEWYGYQPPYIYRGYEWIVGDGGQGHNYPTLLTLQNGDVLQLGSRKSGNTIAYDARLYTASTATWAASAAVVEANLNQANLNAGQIDAVQLPDGTILAFALVEDTITAKIQCNALVSTDSGSTWDVWKKYVWNSAAGELDGTTPVYRLRCAYQIATGEILMCVWYEDGVSASHYRHMLQWASRDLGHTFTQVGAIGNDDTDNQSVSGGVIAINGGFQVWSQNPSNNTAVNGLEYWELGSAFDPIVAGNTGQAYATGNFEVPKGPDDQRFAVCVTDDGQPFVLTENTEPTVDNLYAATIGRGGYRGGVRTTGYGSVLQFGATANKCKAIAATFSRGRLITVCNHESLSSTGDQGMLTALYFGASSTVTHGYTFFDSYNPTLGVFNRRPEYVAGWEQVYVPFAEPDNDGWTLATSGTTSASIGSSDGLLTVSTTGTGTRMYQVSPTSMGERTRALAVVDVSSGVATVEVIHDDGTDRINVKVTIDSLGVVRLYRNPLTLAATLTAVTLPAEVLLEVDTGTAKVWARGWDSSEIQTWEQSASTAVTDTGGASGTGLVEFGCDGVSNDFADWHTFAYAAGVEAGESLIDQSYPDDLHPFPVPAEADGTLYLTDGVRVYAADGPGVSQHEWLISTRYDYPIERVLPTVSPSPALGWRSATTTAGMAVAWKLADVYESALTHAMVYIDGINWRQAQLQSYNPGTSSWVDLFEIQAYIEVEYSRLGRMIYPDGSNTSGEYLHFGEAIGGHFEFSSTKVRKVTHHTSGALIGGADTAQPYIYCEDIDDTEPSSGTGKLWLTRVCLVLAPQNIAALRLQINDDASPVAPPDGYFTIGSLFYGSAQLFGTDYSFGRTVTHEANTEITTARDGRRRSRVNGPPRRSVTFAFPAIDTTRFSDVDTPDLIQTWEYSAITQDEYIARDEPVKLPGILEYCDGPDKPVVYLPRVDRPASIIGTDAAILHKARGAFLGRLTSPVTLTQVAGDESKDEVLSIGSLTLEEEV